MATTPHSSWSLSEISCQFIGCQLSVAWLADYLDTAGAANVKWPTLNSSATRTRNQPLFGFHVQRALQGALPVLFQLGNPAPAAAFAVNADLHLAGNGTAYLLPPVSAYFSATCLIRPAFCGSQEIRMRPASSPNSTNSRNQSVGPSNPPRTPMPLAKPLLGQSDRQAALGAVLGRRRPGPRRSWPRCHFCSAASCSSSSAGGKPQTSPSTSLAYSEEPNSASTSAASPSASELRITSSACPAFRKCGPVALGRPPGCRRRPSPASGKCPRPGSRCRS